MSEAGTMKKRQRASSEETAMQPVESIIDTLPLETLRLILADAAEVHPDVASRIFLEPLRIIAAQKARQGDFGHYVKCVWQTLNADCGCLNGLQKFEKAWAVATEVEECIEGIARSARLRERELVSSIHENRLVLQTLIMIGRSISLSSGRSLGDEVINLFKYNSFLEVAMLETVQSMKGKDPKSKEIKKYVDQLDELRDLGSKFFLFNSFKEPSLADIRSALLELETFPNGGTGKGDCEG